MKKLGFLLSVSGMLAVVASCKKDKDVLGTGLQPNSDLLSAYTYTAPVGIYTDRYDSIVMLNDRYKFIGSNADPILGKTDVGLYVNLNFSQVNVTTYSNNPVLDSAAFIFQLDPTILKGDRDAKITFSVYPVPSGLDHETVYYSSNDRLHTQTPLGVYTVGSYIDGSTAFLKIPLEPAYASSIMNDAAALVNVNEFQKKYNGFYIKASAQPGSEGVIWQTDLDATTCGLHLYYHNDLAPQQEFLFRFTGDYAVRYNTVRHNFASGRSDLASQINGDTLNAQRVYLAGLGIARGNVQLPVNIDVPSGFRIAVNGAQLIFHVDYSSVEELKYKIPAALALSPVSASGIDTLALDQLKLTDNAIYDGNYNENTQTYTFNIARQMQGILNGQKRNRGFHLSAAIPLGTESLIKDEILSRIVIYGSSASENAPQFKINYSLIRIE